MGKGKSSKKKYFIGIDLGGTKMLTGLVKKDFSILAEEKSKVQPEEGPKFFFKSIEEGIEKVLSDSKVKLSQVAGIGVGCPGIIDSAEGRVISSLKNFHLAEKLSGVFDVPVAVGNDVNVGLFGEHQFGAAKDYSDVVGIFLGTGIGGALILGGKLYAGSSGAAGEIGHMNVDPKGPQCGCGNYGCLEALAGRVAIASEAAVLAARQKAPKLYDIAGTDILKIKSGALFKAIAAGDEALKDLILRKAQLIGIAMANLVNLLNPELFVLGGGMVEAMGKIILPEADESMRRYAMPGLAKKVKVAAAKLGDYAIVKGAAKMIADEING